MTAGRAATAQPRADRATRSVERWLRAAGDARLGLGLLLLTGVVNGVAAMLPAGPALLDAWPYAVLLGLLALSGVAAVAVRSPAVWREWRRPTSVQAAAGTLRLDLPSVALDRADQLLQAAGYRTRREVRGERWAVHGVRRGWSRFAALMSHLAIVVVVLGAAIGSASGSEVVFSLLRGEQALLDAPRPGFASAVRLETLDAEFGSDSRPLRLDTTVTFLRAGSAVRTSILRVNEPGDFDGYLVHAWTYGPAVQLRVTTLGGSPLLDSSVPLDGTRGASAVGSAQIPTAGVTLGLSLADGPTNEVGISVVGAGGLLDTARLVPGERARIGPVEVSLRGFDAWVTFVSRRDPGLLVLFGGAAVLCASLVMAFWMPRRRLTLRGDHGNAHLLLRGERFDRPEAELQRLASAFGAAR